MSRKSSVGADQRLSTNVVPITTKTQDRLANLLGPLLRCADSKLSDVALVTAVMDRFLSTYRGPQ